MKNYLVLIVSLFLLNCSEDGSDCFKSQGELVSKEISVELFSQISISEGIELVVKEGEEQKISVTAGENFIQDINFEIIDGELKITNDNSCEMLRNYHSAKVHITTPILEKIYSSSQYSVRSDGVLTYPELVLESGIIVDTPSSVFELMIQNERLVVNDNVSSVFKINGTTQNLEVSFWGSNGRFEGQSLIADQVYVFHRSTNDIIVFPVSKISGTIASTGNLVLKNLPAIVEVEQLYTGHIVYP